MRASIRVVVAAACALLAVIACGLYARHVRGEAERARSESLARYGGELVSVAVATRTLEAGESVSVADVDMREWVSTLVPGGALLELGDVVGKEVGVPVAAGLPFTELNFRKKDGTDKVPSGHVAVSVPVTERLGISAGVETGSHVVAYRVSEDGADLVSADVTVLASPGVASSSMGRGSLLVAVRAEDVTAMLVAGTTGDLRLVIPAPDVRSAELGASRSNDVEPVEGTEGGQAAKDDVGDIDK